MISNMLRASARAGCRRKLHGGVNGPARQQQCPPAFLLSKDSALDRRQRAGLSSSNDSAHHANEKDSAQPPSPPSSTTTALASKTSAWADQWKAVRSKVSAEYLRRFLKKYGRVAAGFHISVFLTTLGTCYTVVDYGGLDITALVKNVPILADNLPPATAGNLAVAYGITSAVGPPRAVLTVLVTPKIAKFLAGRDAKRRNEDETL